MFVLNKARHNVYVALASSWLLAVLYVGMGVGMWAIVLLQPSFIDMHKPVGATGLDVETFTNTGWPPGVYPFLVIAVALYWFVSSRLLNNYEKHKALLEELNAILSGIPAFAVSNSSLRYTLPDVFGPSTTEVKHLGDGRFEVKTREVDVLDETIRSSWYFQVSPDHFSSPGGASLAEMQLARGYLWDVKHYGVPLPKPELVGKRLFRRNPNKGYPLGKRHY